MGNYIDGYKTGKWLYRTSSDSVEITWLVVNEKGVKFNIPDNLEQVKDVSTSVIFQADIKDNDDNSYLVLLRYNLKDLKLSVYDYLYQYNDSWKSNLEETLKSKEFKKFTFKDIEIFRAKVGTKRKIRYEAISYIFVVKGFLYDLTYKNTINKTNSIDLEIFNDIFYSMECEKVDLFNYNSRKYLKEQDVEFK
jgi:hypothetical protein